MNHIKTTSLTILWLQLLLVACKTGNSIVVDDGMNRKEINYQGDIRFNDDETAVESISEDGYLRFRSNGKKLLIESDYHGGFKYEMYKAGTRLSADEPEGKKFLADVIAQMVDMGFNMQKRIERLYSKGGNPAILRAAVNVEGNFAKQEYLDYVLTQGNASPDDLVDVANITAFKIDGAFEKAQLLKKLPRNYSDNGEVTDTWFKAVKTIDGDFEKANTLKEISTGNLSSSAFSQKWLEAVKSINSDYEKCNALKIILQEPLSEEQYRQSIVVSNTIDADFEHANFLKEIIDKKIPESEDGFTALMGAVHNVESDFERANILKKLIDNGLHNDGQWSALLKETATLNGDFEKANVFVSAAAKMPATEELKAVYSNLAKKITSENDYGRAMKAIE